MTTNHKRSQIPVAILSAILIVLPALLFENLVVLERVTLVWVGVLIALNLTALIAGAAVSGTAIYTAQLSRQKRSYALAAIITHICRGETLSEAFRRVAPDYRQAWGEHLEAVWIRKGLRFTAAFAMICYVLIAIGALAWQIAPFYRFASAPSWSLLLVQPVLILPSAAVFGLFGWAMRVMMFSLPENPEESDFNNGWDDSAKSIYSDMSNPKVLLRLLVLAMMSDATLDTIREILKSLRDNLRR